MPDAVRKLLRTTGGLVWFVVGALFIAALGYAVAIGNMGEVSVDILGNPTVTSEGNALLVFVGYLVGALSSLAVSVGVIALAIRIALGKHDDSETTGP